MHEVLLIRPWDVQHTGSGCCGKIGGGEGHFLRDQDPFQEVRRDMERMGAVYQALDRALGGQLHMQVVDPRNFAWLIPTLLRQGYRRAGLHGAWHAVRRGFAHRAIVLDGEVVFQGAIPEPEEAVREFELRLRPRAYAARDF